MVGLAMDLNELKTGKEFIAYWFDDEGAHCDVFKWSNEYESFYVKDKDGDFTQHVYENEFKHTTIVME